MSVAETFQVPLDGIGTKTSQPTLPPTATTNKTILANINATSTQAPQPPTRTETDNTANRLPDKEEHENIPLQLLKLHDSSMCDHGSTTWQGYAWVPQDVQHRKPPTKETLQAATAYTDWTECMKARTTIRTKARDKLAAGMLEYLHCLDNDKIIDEPCNVLGIPSNPFPRHSTNRMKNQLLQLESGDPGWRRTPQWKQQQTQDPALNPYCTDTTPLSESLRLGGPQDHTATQIAPQCGMDPTTSPLYELPTSKAQLRGCMRATLRVRRTGIDDALGTRNIITDPKTLDGSESDIHAVVDSGAAWTAISLATAQALFGIALIPTATTMKFHGASGESLKCLGSVHIQIRMGPLSFTTKAYVFRTLAEPMLLGNNTLMKQGLAVDANNMALYHAEQRTTLPNDAIPLYAASQPQPHSDSMNTLATTQPYRYQLWRNREGTKVYINDSQDPLRSLAVMDGMLYTTRRRRRPLERTPQIQSVVEESQSDCEEPRPHEFRKPGKVTSARHLATVNSLIASRSTDQASQPTNSNQASQTTNSVPASLMASAAMVALQSELSIHNTFARRLLNAATNHQSTIKGQRAGLDWSKPEKLRNYMLGQYERNRQQRVRQGGYYSAMMVAQDVQLPPQGKEDIMLAYDEPFNGPNTSLSIDISSTLLQKTPLATGTDKATGVAYLHQSRNALAIIRLINTTDKPITLLAGTPIADATVYATPDFEALSLYDDETPPHTTETNLTANVSEQDEECQPGNTTLSADGPDVYEAEFEGSTPAIQRYDVQPKWTQEWYENTPAAEGGRMRTKEDLEQVVELDFSQSCDLNKEGQPLLTELQDGSLEELVNAVLYGEDRFARNAKAPTPAMHPLTEVHIDTGDAIPVRQKPYPIPHKYLPAVRKEIESLLSNNLIEPGYSDWSSPVICIIKKDTAAGATGTAIKLKIACDLRMLNSKTIPDSGLLGDQADVLETFRGKPYISLCDAAGGFYQFAIHPDDRKKTCFVLPSACGGTTFQWKVAPYGLQNMPAIYSRAIMHLMEGLQNHDLGYAKNSDGTTRVPPASLGHGSVNTWIDDFTIATGGADQGYGIKGHCEMLRTIFDRLRQANLTLKGSKCHLLRRSLEVLGYIITRDGIKPNPEKVKALRDMPKELNNQKAVYRFLGMINFNRRFIYKIGDKSAPLHALLKKTVSDKNWPWTPQCQQAYDELRNSLTENCLQSHPDLTDPLAEFVVMTDASDIAAGAVLMQWQRRLPFEDNIEDETKPLQVESGDSFLQVHEKRIKAGYTLKTLGYYSKVFADAQKNWAIFDKEAASILLSMEHWHRLIAGRPVTVYTDNTVASSILTNQHYPRPPRLMRWGAILGTYLPNLRIAYRKGELNAVADHMSRYQTDGAPHTCDEVQFPPELYERIEVPGTLADKQFALYEKKDGPQIEAIWNSPVSQDEYTVAPLNSNDETDVESTESNDDLINRIAVLDERPADYDADMAPIYATVYKLVDQVVKNQMLPQEHAQQAERDATLWPNQPSLNGMIDEFLHLVLAKDEQFATEQQDAELEHTHWEQYVKCFRATYDRAPVIYDLFCGEGGYSRGAALAGCTVIGFDKRPQPHTYGQMATSRLQGSNHFEREAIPGMTYDRRDVLAKEFKHELMSMGHIHNHPPPDVIHASPECTSHTIINKLNGDMEDPGDILTVIAMLQEYSTQRAAGRCSEAPPAVVPWTLENVPPAEPAMRQLMKPESTIVTLCGTMFGHHVFRHRPIRSDHDISTGLSCNHEGKHLGNRGLMQRDTAVEGNMYGAYSWRLSRRGTTEQIAQAMGFEPGAFTYEGLRKALPIGYGRILAARCVANVLAANVGMPIWTRNEADHDTTKSTVLSTWAHIGFKPIAQPLHYANELEAEVMHNIDEDNIQNAEPRMPLHPPTFTEDTTPSDWEGPWVISLEHQLRDPRLRFVYESLTATATIMESWNKQRKRTANTHTQHYIIEHEVLKRVTPWGHLQLVPHQRRYELLHVYHTKLDHGGHGGGQKLYDHLRRHYMWDGMWTDCEQFVAHCEVCSSRRTTQLKPTLGGMLHEPPFPFHTVHIDHKTLSESGGFNYVLIVTCRLTRFTMAIPQRKQNAHETIIALMRVFTIFGMPTRMYSDNGPAFKNEMVDAFKQYAGLRHIKVLPNSPQANSPAEQGVRRVADLLHKHTLRHKDWHRTLGAITFALNSTVHSSTQVTPYEAVFGRLPTTVPELEAPHLQRPTYSGTDFVKSLADRLRAAWDTVREASIEIKGDALRKHSKYVQKMAGIRPQPNTGCPGESIGIQVNDRVLLRHGNEQHAKQLRRHGYPAMRTFKVVRLLPKYNAVEIDPDNTSIQPVVSLRHCVKAPREWWVLDDMSTASGIQEEAATSLKAVRANPMEVGGLLHDEQNPNAKIYQVEWIYDAIKSKGSWWYHVLWLGYPDTSWVHEKDLYITDVQLLHLAEMARERYATSHRKSVDATRTRTSPPDRGEDTPEHVPEPIEVDDTPIEAREYPYGKGTIWRYKTLQRRPDGSIRENWKVRQQLPAAIDEALLQQLRNKANGNTEPTNAIAETPQSLFVHDQWYQAIDTTHWQH